MKQLNLIVNHVKQTVIIAINVIQIQKEHAQAVLWDINIHPKLVHNARQVLTSQITIQLLLVQIVAPVTIAQAQVQVH